MNNSLTKNDISKFSKYLTESEKSTVTIEKYTASLRRLSKWLGGRKLTKENLLEYRNHLLESLTAQTVNGALSAINSYLAFSGMQDMRMKLFRVQKKLFRSSEKELTKAEYERLISTAKDTEKERLALLMETICSTGIRVGEVKYITVEAASEEKKRKFPLKAKRGLSSSQASSAASFLNMQRDAV